MKAKRSTSTWSAVTKDPRHKTSSGSSRDPVLTKRASVPAQGPEAFSLVEKESKGSSRISETTLHPGSLPSDGKGSEKSSAQQLVTSLYVHVPFCAQKCEYCAFFSEASSGELINRYTEALIRELELVADNLKPRTIFFGGGTPSILNLRQWEKIFLAMRRLNLTGAEEWTVRSE